MTASARPAGHPRLARVLAGVAVLLAGLTIGGWRLAAPAQAHATIVSSEPGDGARLATGPAQVSITFDEQVGLAGVGYLHVINQTGQRVDVGSAYHPQGNGTVVTVNLKSGLGTGVYTESYRVISADSHPVAGTLRFVVGDAVLTPQTAAPVAVTDRAVGIGFAVVRWVGFAGLSLLGGLWVLLALWTPGRGQRRSGRIVWTGWGLSVAGALGQLALQGPYSAGENLASLSRWSLLDTTLHSDYGQILLGRLVVLAVLAFLLDLALTPARTVGGYARSVFVALAVLLAWTFSALGHPRTTAPAWLSVPVDVLHLLAMAVWVGGLAMLIAVVLVRAVPPELERVLPRFSRVALASVTVLAGTGTYAAWRGIGSLHAITTTYGWLVLAKVALFFGILAIANVSRIAAGRRLAQTIANPSRVRRAVLLELAVAVVVLAVTAVLVAQPRGREALATRQLRPLSATAALGAGRTVRLTIDPGHHGTVSAYAVLSAGAKPISVQATAALPAAQLGPIPLGLTPDGPDRFSASAVSLPVAGRWTFTIIVSTSQFDATTTSITLHLP